MNDADLRVKMAIETFDAITEYEDPEYLTFDFWEALIDPLYRHVQTWKDRTDVLLQMNDAQRSFFTFTEIHKEIYNGGIAQFFWNQYDLKDYAIKTFEALEDGQLTSMYRDLLADLENKLPRLKELRAKNDFAAFAEHLHADEFEDTFFDRAEALQQSMLRYVRNNRDQFIKD